MGLAAVAAALIAFVLTTDDPEPKREVAVDTPETDASGGADLEAITLKWTAGVRFRDVETGEHLAEAEANTSFTIELADAYRDPRGADTVAVVRLSPADGLDLCLSEPAGDALVVPRVYVDAAQIHVQSFSLHLLLGANSFDGHPEPQVQVTMSPQFATHLKDALTQALASYEADSDGADS